LRPIFKPIFHPNNFQAIKEKKEKEIAKMLDLAGDDINPTAIHITDNLIDILNRTPSQINSIPAISSEIDSNPNPNPNPNPNLTPFNELSGIDSNPINFSDIDPNPVSDIDPNPVVL
jgi:hypothetical protein